MNEIKIFENKEFGEVRTILINDKPYFVGKDVAAILGYAKPLNALATHIDEDDSLKQGLIDSMGRMQETILINESGLYSLIFSSNMPNAKKFKHWVTSEVLPSIRKTGGYSVESQLPRTYLEALKALVVSEEQKLALQTENEQMKPKALFADCVTASETSILVREFAKILRQNGADMGEKRLYNWFRDNGYVIKGSTHPTQKSMEQGLFEVIERTVSRGSQPPKVYLTTKITGKGQVFFANKILGEKQCS